MQITLKAARINKNLTQQEAAEAIGTTKDVISNWERGKSFPNVIMLEKIEQIYGVSYKDIIFLPQSYA
jgi:transcriptional regulator with XRE-family HTH domain